MRTEPRTDANGYVDLVVVDPSVNGLRNLTVTATHPLDASRVGVIDVATSDDSSPTILIPGTPAVPTQPVVKTINGEVQLSWTEPWNGGAFIDYYKVWVATDASGPYELVSQGSCAGKISPESRSCSVTGLTEGVTYYFARSTATALRFVVPKAPDAPTNVVSSIANKSAEVSWLPPANDGDSPILDYKVSWTTGSQVCQASPCTITGLINGTSYAFQVSARNEIGESSQSVASESVIPATTPDAPTNVSATGVNEGANLSWSIPADNGSAITGYKVSWLSGSQTCSESPCLVTNLQNGTKYVFSVSAINGIGESAGSENSIEVTPAAPTAVLGSGVQESAEYPSLPNGTYDCNTGLKGWADQYNPNSRYYSIWANEVTDSRGCVGSVLIPEGVRSIGPYAFADLSRMTDITIPSSVTSIGGCAFCYTSLTVVAIPSSVNNIESNSFQQIPTLISINVALENMSYASLDGVLFDKSIEKLISYPAGKVDSPYIVPEGVTTIGESAFKYVNSLPSITLPTSVESIEDYAFYMAFSPDSNLSIPEGVATIGNYAFIYSGLASISIPASVTSIGTEAFGSLRRLTSITVASENQTYSSQGGVLFDEDETTLITYPSRKGDKSFVIPPTVTTISIRAFEGASNLINVSIPASVTTIGGSAFYGARSLSRFYFLGNAPAAGDQAFKDVLDAGRAVVASGAIGFGENGSFWKNLRVEEVSGVTSDPIIESVTNGDRQVTISLLEPFYTGGATITNYEYSFNLFTWSTVPPITDSGPFTISIQGLNNSQNYRLFVRAQTVAGSGDPSRTIEFTPNVPDGTYDCNTGQPSSGASNYYYVSSSSIVYVSDAYDDGKGCVGEIVIPAGITAIGSHAFIDNAALNKVMFESGSQLKSIGNGAFKNATSLTEINIPEGVKTIGKNAFMNAISLTSIAIPAGVTRLEELTLADTTSLKAVTFSPDSELEFIGRGAFQSASSLTSITIPASVGYIGDYAFYSTISLSKFYFLGDAPILGNENPSWGASNVFWQAWDSADSMVIVRPASSGFGSPGDIWQRLRVENLGIPSRPNVTSIEVDSNEVMLNFTAPSYDGDSVITDYEFSIDGGAWMSAMMATSPITIPGLTNGQTYAIQLRAVNAFGPGSASGVTNATPRVTYTVTYFYNSATGENSISSASFTTGGTAIRLPTPTRTGYTFAGWFSDAALTSKIGNGGAGYSPSGSTVAINAYAKWTSNKATATVKPTFGGVAKVGKTLTAKTGTWVGKPKPQIKIQWYSCSKAVTSVSSTVLSTCKAISGANKSTFKLTSAQKGKWVTVLVTGTSSGTSKTSWLAKSTGKVQ
jgi:uncharacterized repeat protein (TIGR02543 family)